RVRDHRIKGVEAFNREDYETALAEFRAIAREDPDDPQVHLHLGSTLLALGRPDEAQAALERCLALDPRNERGLAEMGRLHALANRLDQAIATLEKAVAVNPEFAEPHYYLAGIYMARGEADRYREELKIFERLQARSTGSALDVQPERAP
ncbi:MAG TPA: tetratricopeptide repeat protein, partial [Candidatus Binatia bacterium]|nr:tetratricopeptide repeat protein [Candidatus Binatia bacterium]